MKFKVGDIYYNYYHGYIVILEVRFHTSIVFYKGTKTLRDWFSIYGSLAEDLTLVYGG
jgi:hypothetical protein